MLNFGNKNTSIYINDSYCNSVCMFLEFVVKGSSLAFLARANELLAIYSKLDLIKNFRFWFFFLKSFSKYLKVEFFKTI